MGKIIHGDSLEVLPQLDGQFGLILTDPPYNISYELKLNRGSQGKYKGNDITCDMGEWDRFSDEEYYQFTKTWASECVRLLIPGGYFISFFDKRRLSWLPDILEPLGLRVRDVFTWIKSNPVPQVRKVKFAQATEMAVILSKPGPNLFRWQNGYHPNYIKLPIVGGHERLKDADGCTLHTTQKPLKLFRLFIDYFATPEYPILDPFAGTCTLAVAATQAGREWVCVEREQKYVEAGLKRLQQVEVSFFDVDYKSKAYKEKYL